LCEDNQIHVGEIWSYHIVGDQPRFTLVHRSKEAPPVVRTKPLVKAPVKPAAPRPAAAPKKPEPPRAPKPARAIKKAAKKVVKKKRK
jgi:hypothetical protein